MTKDELLTQAEGYLLRNLQVIHDMRTGKSEAKACKDNNVKLSKFRNFVFSNPDKPYEEQTPVIKKGYAVLSTGYEYLFALVMVYNRGWKIEEYPDGLIVVKMKGNDYMPEDIERSMKAVLRTLSPREQKVLTCRGIRRMTLEETGKELGINRERIRQIEAKAMRKLNHPSRANVMYLGIDYMDKINSVKEEARNQARTEFNEELERIKKIAYREERNRCFNENGAYDKNHPLSMSLDDLEFSVRTYNCLIRAGVKTAQDIADMSLADLTCVRNLGRKSRDEVVNKMKELGIVIS